MYSIIHFFFILLHFSLREAECFDECLIIKVNYSYSCYFFGRKQQIIQGTGEKFLEGDTDV